MKQVVWFLILALAISATAFAQQDPADIGAADTVRIGCPLEISPAVEGDSFGIPVYLWCDEDVYGFSLGFNYNSDLVEIVSWDLTGGVVPVAAHENVYAHFLPEQNTALVGWIDLTFELGIDPMASGPAQLLGTMYMKVVGQVDDLDVDLDSVFVGPAGDFIIAADSGSGATPFIVQVTPQYVDCGTADVHLQGYLCGDADFDGLANITDAVYIINYIFNSGPEPTPYAAGDVNCDTIVNITDAVYLISWIFGGGSGPCDTDNDGQPDC
ncbi:MAG: dockerin type I domain-containing protein [bacterium]